MNQEWIQIIQDRFADGPPNGWLEGWDCRRFENEIRKLVAPLEMTNETSFDYEFCNTYEIKVETKKPAGYRIFKIQVSFILDVFSTQWDRPERDGRPVKLKPGYLFAMCGNLEQNIREFLIERQFEEIANEDYNRNVAGVMLELSGSENVTLTKCLFEDFEG